MDTKKVESPETRVESRKVRRLAFSRPASGSPLLALRSLMLSTLSSGLFHD
jgi:hypothetical protein